MKLVRAPRERHGQRVAELEGSSLTPGSLGILNRDATLASHACQPAMPSPMEACISHSTPISSECPRCHQDRIQPGYSRDELLQLLRQGAEIEAYCSSCDQHWPISVEERADIARALGR